MARRSEGWPWWAKGILLLVIVLVLNLYARGVLKRMESRIR